MRKSRKSGTQDIPTHNYTLKPGLEGWQYEDLGAARLALIWWLDTHGQHTGNVYDMGKRLGVIELIDNYWTWKPVGGRKRVKINPRTGETG
jgi:hypothetical protein